VAGLPVALAALAIYGVPTYVDAAVVSQQRIAMDGGNRFSKLLLAASG
jgi:hypothetical protein